MTQVRRHRAIGTILVVALSGFLMGFDGSLFTGRVGDQVDLEFGKNAARQTGLAILATLRAGLGNLDRVKRVVKTLGMVYSTPEFDKHPAVINGCSELWRLKCGMVLPKFNS